VRSTDDLGVPRHPGRFRGRGAIVIAHEPYSGMIQAQLARSAEWSHPIRRRTLSSVPKAVAGRLIADGFFFFSFSSC
jgi:hypothetical protein